MNSLALVGSDLGDEELGFLTSFANLGFLNLSGTKITDEGLGQLAKIHGLQLLRIKNTGVTVPGVAEYAKAMPKCQVDWDNATIKTTPSDDSDRRAAKWMLARGGWVQVRQGERSFEVKSINQSPATVFELTEVYNRDILARGTWRISGCCAA